MDSKSPKALPSNVDSGATIRDLSDDAKSSSSEGERPPLPPRPSALSVLQRSTTEASPASQALQRPRLVSAATTAVSSTNIQSQGAIDGTRLGHRPAIKHSASKASLQAATSTPRSKKSSRTRAESDVSDATSLRSTVPTLSGTDAESLLGDVLGADSSLAAWKLQDNQSETHRLDFLPWDNEEPTADFSREFDELPELDESSENEERLLEQWRSKRKHFMILSQSGKPIWIRHGSDGLISGYVGIIQTIISFYESVGDQLRTFTAGKARFVVMSQGPLYLVAISKLGESDAQLRSQLDALYMQILSTLTLPNLTKMFSLRPSADLRRPLQGTETLLSALADSFTRGSPSNLLSALECLKIRNTQRQAINSLLLKHKCSDLLYGLVVAGGRLVSVVRPRTHSLHPSDLQLIFNMLFEADGVQAGGGESWIPMCLPGFNKNGYLYMYVSYLDAGSDDVPGATASESNGNEEDEPTPNPRVIDPSDIPKEQRIAILLISANKEAFFALRKCRDAIVSSLSAGQHLRSIRQAIQRGRPQVSDIVPGAILHHFLYKSKGNLQFVMPSYEPHFETMLERRRLFNCYEALHASIHVKGSHLKVHHSVSREYVSLAWTTDVFELYCIAGPRVGRNALAQAANKIVQWLRKEEERMFIIGGAVF